MNRGTDAIVDYSVLYDGVVRKTLWKEVKLVMFTSLNDCDVIRVDIDLASLLYFELIL